VAIDYPLINGVRYTWASIVVNIGALQFLGCKSININEKGDATKMRGTTQTILGAGAPQYDADGDCEFYQAEADTIISALGQAWMNQALKITVQYIDDNQPTRTKKLVVRLAGRTQGGTEGPEILTSKFPLFFLAPVEDNGITAVPGVSPFSIPAITRALLIA
jgi:hypothetical protein